VSSAGRNEGLIHHLTQLGLSTWVYSRRLLSSVRTDGIEEVTGSNPVGSQKQAPPVFGFTGIVLMILMRKLLVRFYSCTVPAAWLDYQPVIGS